MDHYCLRHTVGETKLACLNEIFECSTAAVDENRCPKLIKSTRSLFTCLSRSELPSDINYMIYCMSKKSCQCLYIEFI